MVCKALARSLVKCLRPAELCRIAAVVVLEINELLTGVSSSRYVGQEIEAYFKIGEDKGVPKLVYLDLIPI